MERLRDRSVWSLDDHYLVAEQECLLPHMPTLGKSVVLIFLKLYIYSTPIIDEEILSGRISKWISIKVGRPKTADYNSGP